MFKVDLQDANRVFQTVKQAFGSTQSVWGVFVVQIASGLGASDVSKKRLGMALISAAENHGVEFFLYTSTDRVVYSYNNGTYAIEHRLVEGDGSEDRKIQ